MREVISASRSDKDVHAKREGESSEVKVSKAASSSRQWSAFRNPRIVRVSRAFGGKDRHSKVCTVRGLRDRRIRLSVPTAIQLYDLQDKLGLNQPSKVIDWLLDATKNDIDKLPPLQMPHGGFAQFHEFPPSVSPFLGDARFHPFEDHNTMIASLRMKSKEAEGVDEKEKWVRTIGDENEDEMVGFSSQMSAQKLFPLSNCHSSFTTASPFNSFYHLDPSSLSLSQLGNHGFLSHSETSLPNAAITIPSSQLLFYPPPASLPSFFPSYPPFLSTAMESDPRDISHFSLNVNVGVGHDRTSDSNHNQERGVDS